MELPKNQMIDYAPAMPQMNASAAGAQGAGIAAIGQDIQKVGSMGMDVFERLRKADEMGKSLDAENNATLELAKFNASLLTNPDYASWPGLLDAKLGELLKTPEGLSAEGKQAWQARMTKLAGDARERVIMLQATKMSESAKASLGAAMQTREDLGDHAGAKDLLNKNYAIAGLSDGQKEQIAVGIDERGSALADSGRLATLESKGTLDDANKALSGLQGKTPEQWAAEEPGRKAEDYPKQLNAVESIVEKKKSKILGDISNMRKSGEIKTEADVKEFLKNNPGLDEHQQAAVIQLVTNEQPINYQRDLARRTEISAQGDAYLQGSRTPEERKALALYIEKERNEAMTLPDAEKESRLRALAAIDPMVLDDIKEKGVNASTSSRLTHISSQMDVQLGKHMGDLTWNRSDAKNKDITDQDLISHNAEVDRAGDLARQAGAQAIQAELAKNPTATDADLLKAARAAYTPVIFKSVTSAANKEKSKQEELRAAEEKAKRGPVVIEGKAGNAAFSSKTRDQFPAGYSRRGQRLIATDFNSGGKGSRGVLCVIPNDATPEERQAAQSYVDQTVAWFNKNGVPVPSGKVLTAAENGKGVSNQFHTEPFMIEDTESLAIMQKDPQGYASILAGTLGAIPGSTIIKPHEQGKDGAGGSGTSEQGYYDSHLLPSLRALGAPQGSSQEKPATASAKTTHYGYKGDPNWDYNSSIGVGAFVSDTEKLQIVAGKDTPNKLKQGDIAVSPDMENKFRSAGIKPGEAVTVTLKDGRKHTGRWMDRTRSDLVGRVDIYSPNGPTNIDDQPVIGFHKV